MGPHTLVGEGKGGGRFRGSEVRVADVRIGGQRHFEAIGMPFAVGVTADEV